ncbi:hypothetical protein KFE25_009647 [Diacronema lutheri]|uniref:Uncharacterized protein n=1 Tax=Diacronema lutheri TaxID=2081491 RepID=A0A8J5XY76_DIALT|nr:hypothetical protein KFE25_009647 [Diacronema lutheri]
MATPRSLEKSVDAAHEYFEEIARVNPTCQPGSSLCHIGHNEAMGGPAFGIGEDHDEKHSYDFIMNPKTHTPNWFDTVAFGGAAGVTNVLSKMVPGMEGLMKGNFGLLPCDNPMNRQTCQNYDDAA